MPPETLLDAQQLVRHYHDRRVLHGVDLQLDRGEVLGFLGPNGAGKSTTMNIICGVLAPHAGTVTICGHDLAMAPLQAKRHIGYLPETPPLHDDATVDEYLMFCGRLRGLDRRAARSAMQTTKPDCGLDEVGDRLIGNLSKGFRQRVGIAQALLHRPAVVVLDEPTSGLDPNQIRTVRDTIARLAEHHAVILSTHILSEVQMLCDRVVILHQGHVRLNERLNVQSKSLYVELSDRDSAPDWGQIRGVLSGESIGNGRYRLTVEDYEGAAAAICEVASKDQLGLLELTRHGSALEQTFVDLTCRDVEVES